MSSYEYVICLLMTYFEYLKIGKPMAPVARIVLQRTLIRGNQCPNNQHERHKSPRIYNDHRNVSPYVDLSKAKDRNERLKQKYDYSGRLIYAYSNLFIDFYELFF